MAKKVPEHQQSMNIIEDAFSQVANTKGRGYSNYLSEMGEGAFMRRACDVKNPIKKERFIFSKISTNANPVFLAMAQVENNHGVNLEEITMLKTNQDMTDRIMRPLMQARNKENIL